MLETTSRYFLAALFLFAVGAKLHTANEPIDSFFANVPRLVGESWGLSVAIAVIVAESAVAALLLCKRTAVYGAAGAAMLLLSFAAYALYYRFGLGHEKGLECGCFGGIISSQLGVTTALRNLLLAVPAALILGARRIPNACRKENPIVSLGLLPRGSGVIPMLFLLLFLSTSTTWSQGTASDWRRQMEAQSQRQIQQMERLAQQMRERNAQVAQANQERLRQMEADRQAANARAQQRQAEFLARQKAAQDANAAGWAETGRVVKEETTKWVQADQERRQRVVDDFRAGSAQRARDREEAMATADADAQTSTISHAAEANPTSNTFVGERYPQTRACLVSEDQAALMSFAQLRYAINEVYARYGAPFTSKPELRKQFSQFHWYKPQDVSYSSIEGQLTATERQNLETLAKYRDMKK